MDENEGTESPASEPADTSTDTPAAGGDGGQQPTETALEAVSAAIDAETPESVRAGGDEPAGSEEATVGEHTEEAPAAPVEGKVAKPAEEQKPAGEPPAAKQASPPDAVNDPIPTDIRGKTRERMTTLISTVKDMTAERDRYLSERDELVGMIQQTRATPEQYGQALDYLRAVNSGDPAQIRQAIKTAQEELRALSAMIGEPVSGVDLLASHADLRAALETGGLSQEHATEIAAARAHRTYQEQSGQRLAEHNQHQEAIEAGKSALNQLEQQLQTDPLYATKRQMLIPVLQPILAQLPPQQWANAFKSAYDKLSVQSPAPSVIPASTGQPVPARRAPANNQPLRARQPAGNSSKQPGSMLDALNEGIDRASRH